MDEQAFWETQKRIGAFFHSDERFVEFGLDCPVEDRIEYVRRMQRPWLTPARLNFNFCVAKLAEMIPLSSIKIAIYRMMGVTIGKGVFISPDVILDPHFPRLIVLEDYAVLGWGAKIATHEMSTRKYRIGRVVIGKGAVVGGCSIIRAGIKVGENAQTCANSYIHRNVPPGHSGRPQGPP